MAVLEWLCGWRVEPSLMVARGELVAHAPETTLTSSPVLVTAVETLELRRG